VVGTHRNSDSGRPEDVMVASSRCRVIDVEHCR
jgi:hypothetical protein